MVHIYVELNIRKNCVLDDDIDSIQLVNADPAVARVTAVVRGEECTAEWENAFERVLTLAVHTIEVKPNTLVTII
jgi:hypothetical protein